MAKEREADYVLSNRKHRPCSYGKARTLNREITAPEQSPAGSLQELHEIPLEPRDYSSDHSGHRDRLRRRYLESGIESLQDYEVLELLLFYAIPRKDTKPIAKNLLDRFGGLHGVLEASVDDLTGAGLSTNAAVLVHILPEMQKRYERSKDAERKYIRSTADAGRIACGMFCNQMEESVRMLCLNAGGRVVRSSEIAKGDVNAVYFPIRKIVEIAIGARAVSVILVHNHPGGTLSPSREDLDATESARSALNTVGVRLLDHLIVSGTDYCSLREEGYFG